MPLHHFCSLLGYAFTSGADWGRRFYWLGGRLVMLEAPQRGPGVESLEIFPGFESRITWNWHFHFLNFSPLHT